MEVSIIILVVVAIAETVLNSRWLPFYFLNGIPLFKKTVSIVETPCLSPDDLTNQFSQGITTPIVFAPIGEDLIAFREKMISFRFFHYTPVMHGLIRVDRDRLEISVTGYANWFSLLFAFIFPAAFITNSPAKSELGFIIPFLLVLFGSLYAIQFYRFTKILEAIKQKPYMPSQPLMQQQSVLTKKINNKVLAVIVVVLVVVWVIPTFIAAFDRDLFLWLTMSGKTVKLAPSGQNGKFVYDHSAKIRFSAEPQYPVYISIRKVVHDGPPPKPEHTIIVSKGDQYAIQANLASGDYEIYSSLDPKDDCCSDTGKYWGAFGGQIHIQNDGKSKTEEQAIIHYLKMQIISPVSKSLVAEKRPTLRWKSVPGAVQYKVDWRNDKRNFGHEKTASPEFTFGKDIEAATVYHWDVEAFNKSGEKIAYYSEPSFKTPSQ
ncbi:hypothetical protein [Trichlorobacter lovleyi]|uniref:hypothetical protein n=1 Tax=Trichlorobacter lovleyi TaxID=313985 RepID=UPI00223FBDE3|nr:hypothetical protein [Trichlorobacter lovleyi]